VIEIIDIGLSTGKHIFVDLPRDEVTLYHLFPNGRRYLLGTVSVEEFMTILKNRKEEVAEEH